MKSVELKMVLRKERSRFFSGDAIPQFYRLCDKAYKIYILAATSSTRTMASI